MRKTLRFAAPLLVLALLAGCSGTPPEGVTREAWNVGILVMDGVYNTEMVGPYDVFDHADPFRVFTIAPEQRELVTAEGIRFQPDHDFSDHPPIHILVVPSFEDYEEDLDREPLLAWIRERAGEADWILSHCWGAFYLAAAGLLDGRQATTYPPDIDNFAARFPAVEAMKGYRFVRDDRFITSVGGVASFESPLFLVRRLAGDETARRVAGGLVISDWRLEQISYLER